VGTQIVADVRQSRDDLAKVVLAQTSTLVGIQIFQRARAAIQGVTLPLDAEEFSDPTRLSIDIGAARLLQRELGRDQNVVAWMQAGLLARARSPMISATGAAVRVHGIRLVVPFLLQPAETTRSSTPPPAGAAHLDRRRDRRFRGQPCGGSGPESRGTPRLREHLARGPGTDCRLLLAARCIRRRPRCMSRDRPQCRRA
jgi:hypothetical protein